MPQIALDYSANITQPVDVSVLQLVNKFVSTSIECDANAIKSRLIKIDNFVIGHGDKVAGKEQAFVTLVVDLLPGRSDADKKMLGHGLQKILQEYFAASAESFALQIRVKIDELAADFYFM
jgi:5-carboxymethyl-2-hydroxymuconate isomerase